MGRPAGSDDPDFSSLGIGAYRWHALQDGAGHRLDPLAHRAPPDHAPSIPIAIEHVTDERRWQAVLLLGSDEPPPLPERYESRHRALLERGETDEYRDALGEEYDPDAMALEYDGQPIESLMREFAESDRTPRELGQLHQYIETRHIGELAVQMRMNTARVLSTCEGEADYLRGVLLSRTVDIPGFSHEMSVAQIMELGVGGDLSPLELGAVLGHLVERRVIAEAHRVAESIMLAPHRIASRRE